MAARKRRNTAPATQAHDTVANTGAGRAGETRGDTSIDGTRALLEELQSRVSDEMHGAGEISDGARALVKEAVHRLEHVDASSRRDATLPHGAMHTDEQAAKISDLHASTTQFKSASIGSPDWLQALQHLIELLQDFDVIPSSTSTGA